MDDINFKYMDNNLKNIALQDLHGWHFLFFSSFLLKKIPIIRNLVLNYLVSHPCFHENSIDILSWSNQLDELVVYLKKTVTVVKINNCVTKTNFTDIVILFLMSNFINSLATDPVGNDLFKVIIGNDRTMHEICSKLTSFSCLYC